MTLFSPSGEQVDLVFPYVVEGNVEVMLISALEQAVHLSDLPGAQMDEDIVAALVAVADSTGNFVHSCLKRGDAIERQRRSLQTQAAEQ